MLGDILTRFLPFRMMQDATTGSFEQQVAAYRHNRRMRKGLLACMGRWAVSCVVAIALTTYFEALGAGPSGLYSLLATAGGLFVTCSVFVLILSAFVYIHLSYEQR